MTQRHRPTPSRRALRLAALTAALAMLLSLTGAAYVYVKLNRNIEGVDIDGALGTERPTDFDNGSMDILVLGSDSRSGSNQKAGGGKDDGTARSDTAMIVHIYQGHKKAGLVSIPRDTIVDRPPCGEHGSARGVMFNSAYMVGGPACAVKTVEAMTAIRMDHYIEVDFSGFQKLIDALGGVTVTTGQDIDDKRSHLHLKAGTHTLTGKQALGLVRTRYGVGDGSDLGRVQLQQDFVKALVDRVDSLGLLTSPTRLYEVADTATGAITTDSDLASVDALVGLGQSIKSIGSDDIDLLTMPVQYDPADPNRVIPLTDQADLVWAALRADRAIPESATDGSAADQVDTKGVLEQRAAQRPE